MDSVTRHKNSPRVKSVILALAREDKALVEAEDALEQAQAEFDVALSRYLGVRDLAIMRYQHDPYAAVEHVEDDYGVSFPSEGRYRFQGMNPGRVATLILKQNEGPMTLDEIVNSAREGGMASYDSRRINAAIMNNNRIAKDDVTGLYEYVPLKEVEPEDIPFE